MEKERTLLKRVGVQPTAEPLCAMHKIVEEQDEAMDKCYEQYISSFLL
jgi:hypothetical protein